MLAQVEWRLRADATRVAVCHVLRRPWLSMRRTTSRSNLATSRKAPSEALINPATRPIPARPLSEPTARVNLLPTQPSLRSPLVPESVSAFIGE